MSNISRRGFLKTAVGAALLGPFAREAFAETTKPARVVIVVECNCIYPIAFLSSGARASLGDKVGSDIMFSSTYPTTARTLTGDGLGSALCLAPLLSSDGNLSLENRAAAVLGLSNLVAGGGHTTGTGALSCAVDGSSATIDAVLAPKLKRTAPFDAIRLGTSAALVPIAYQTCSFGPKKPAPIFVNPTLAYNSIFGAMLTAQGATGQRSSLFDFAKADVKDALATFRGNSNERIKLERYLASLEALGARETRLSQMAGSVRPLLPPSPKTNPLLTGTGSPPDSLMWLEAQFEIATTTLLGGLTNTVVLASGTSGFDVHYDSIISGIGRHDLQHGIETPANWTAIAAVTRKHVELIAKLARTLAKTPEVNGQGTMLDNTIIVYMSDNGEQHHSTGREWPVLLVGGNGLGFKTDGRTVIFPEAGQANNRQISNLFNALGHAAGDAGFNTFGNEGSARIAEGPLSELFA